MHDDGSSVTAESTQKVLIDTNVALDLLLNREPYVYDSLEIFAYAETGKIRLLLSADAISTIFYIVEKNRGRAAGREAIAKILDYVELAPLEEKTVLRGIALDFDDVEDGLVAAAADKAGAVVIVTRNLEDFKKSPVPVMDPKMFLAALKSRQSEK